MPVALVHQALLASYNIAMYTLKPSPLAGCYELLPKVFKDARGSFVKPFHAPAFEQLGLESAFVEDFYTVSHQHVVRGLHFQKPPADHVKLVYCVQGEVLDAVVDLRVGSSSYGQYALFQLSAETANSVYIPKGMAHGFCVTSAQATLAYKVTTVHSVQHDSGILWHSAGIPWPVTQPQVSERDGGLCPLNQFQSPFQYA